MKDRTAICFFYILFHILYTMLRFYQILYLGNCSIQNIKFYCIHNMQRLQKSFQETKLFFYLTYIILFIMYGWYQASGKLSFIKIMMILFTINPTPPVKNKQSETKPQFSRCLHVNDSVYFIYNTQITLYSSRWYLHHILEKKKLCPFFLHNHHTHH